MVTLSKVRWIELDFFLAPRIKFANSSKRGRLTELVKIYVADAFTACHVHHALELDVVQVFA